MGLNRRPPTTKTELFLIIQTRCRYERAEAWQGGAGSFGNRRRLYGNERFLRDGGGGRINRDDSSSARIGNQLPRHRRCLRTFHQRGIGWEGHSRPSRRGGDCDQVWKRTTGGRHLGWDQWPTRVRPASV